MKIPDPAHAAAQPGIECVPFGRTPDGTAVDLYRLTNSHGLGATITTYGGIVRSLLVPDREGKLGDIVLGYHNLAGYLAKSPYFGCLVGRYGNRFARGEFKLDGQTYALAKNDGENHLHGGRTGFDKVVWAAKPLPRRVGSPPAMPAAHHRGRVWEPFEGSHVDPLGSPPAIKDSPLTLQLQYLSKDGEEGYPAQ